MKVLKFGGSSLASAASIKLISAIIKKEVKQQKIWVVVSASGKTTDQLLKLTKQALEKNEAYKSGIKQVEQHHIAICKDLLPIAKQTTVISIKTSHKPRFKRKTATPFFDFRRPTRNADMPAKKAKAGAQK